MRVVVDSTPGARRRTPSSPWGTRPCAQAVIKVTSPVPAAETPPSLHYRREQPSPSPQLAVFQPLRPGSGGVYVCEHVVHWARREEHIVGVTRLRLEAAELDPGCAYEASPRAQMAAQEAGAAAAERYVDPWGEWSRPSSFPSPGRRGPLPPPWAGPDSSLVALSVLLLPTSLTCRLFTLSPGTRVKRTLCQSMPSPASFFQPLYGVHNGDFQHLLPSSRGMEAETEGPVQELGCTWWETMSLHGLNCPLPPCARLQTWAGTCHAALQLSQGGDSPWPEALESDFGEAVLPLTLATYSAAQPWQPEDWGLGSPLRPTPSDPEGGSSDYCTLGCDLGPLSLLW
ncbi:interleukin-9 receptor-like [Tamandua tetradactyla]|uniref:interleukin-9 receptor-like n=1 Tax=Tamandua tetradactyla TaxID=48850 RepID=UPI004054641D